MEILDFKAWNNLMPPGKRFMAIARVKLPGSGMSVRFEKFSDNEEEIILEVVVEFRDELEGSENGAMEIDIRYDEEGVSYEKAGLVSGESVEVGEVS